MSQSNFGWKQIFAILALIGIILSMIGTVWLTDVPVDTSAPVVSPN